MDACQAERENISHNWANQQTMQLVKSKSAQAPIMQLHRLALLSLTSLHLSSHCHGACDDGRQSHHLNDDAKAAATVTMMRGSREHSGLLTTFFLTISPHSRRCRLYPLGSTKHLDKFSFFFFHLISNHNGGHNTATVPSPRMHSGHPCSQGQLPHHSQHATASTPSPTYRPTNSILPNHRHLDTMVTTVAATVMMMT